MTSATIHYNYVPIQTLTIININNANEVVSFTMPRGMSWQDFVGSDYDTSGGDFLLPKTDGGHGYEEPSPLYKSQSLSNTINGSVYASGLAEGKFYYEGEAIQTLIFFTVGGETYRAEQGMTWAEWCESNYNTEGCYIGEHYLWSDELLTNIDRNCILADHGYSAIAITLKCEGCVLSSDTIINGFNYVWHAMTHTGGSA